LWFALKIERTQPPSQTQDFTVLEETPDLLVIDKPAGLLIHPTKPGGPYTLWDGVREFLAFEMASGAVPGIVNRLDRETSGLVLVAKNSAASAKCGTAMSSGGIEKEYLALVTGHPACDIFEVSLPILRAGEVGPSRIWLKRIPHPDGQKACTRFEVLGRWVHDRAGPLALVRAQPLTGRTHQIRVHLAANGTPVLGDKIYGPSEGCYLEFIESGWTASLARRLHHHRHALHSSVISLCWEGSRVRWESGLPPDLLFWLPAGLVRGSGRDARQ